MTEKQLEANRENAKHSTGPKTEEGKAKSAANSQKHCLTGGPVCLESESYEAFEELLQQIKRTYQPFTAVGDWVVTQIANTMWRMARADRMLGELEYASLNAFAEEDDTLLKRIERLERHRRSIERSYHRFVKQWERCKTTNGNSAAKRSGNRAKPPQAQPKIL